MIMGKKRKALSQEEIWDDSALIQSWDDALEEYKVESGRESFELNSFTDYCSYITAFMHGGSV